MLDRKVIDILEQVVAKDGDCFSHERCPGCPFKDECFSDKLHFRGIDKKKRANKALDMIWINSALYNE